jgi:hypothetical protein
MDHRYIANMETNTYVYRVAVLFVRRVSVRSIQRREGED